MPELPEVETIRLGLKKTIIDQKISHVEVLLAKMFIGEVSLAIGSVVKSVGRRGKLLLIELNKNGEKGWITIHLKMTGQLLFRSKTRAEFGLGHPIPPLNTPVPNKSTKVIFTFESGDVLYFNDIRTFGYVKALTELELKAEPFLLSVGVEPLSEEFTFEQFEKLLKKSPRLHIKTFLLDQTKVAGLGNIYTDEALFLARILPTRLVGSLGEDERLRLFEAIQEVLRAGIELHGSSKTSYVTVDGATGTFLARAAVYQRGGKPCLNCGRPITKVTFRGRGTHFCENCQT
jgi:formamidopyrimidine-DNA glycosylase